MKLVVFTAAVLLLSHVAVRVSASDDALFAAVRADDPDAIEAAINDGGNINGIGPGGQTPLMHATLTGQVEAVRVLLKLGADTTIGEKDGYTPMHGAGFQGRAKIAELLIAHGLDPLDRHEDGFIPLHRACWGREQRHTDTVRVFLEAGGVSPSTKAAKKAGGHTPLVMADNNPATKKLIREALQEEKRQKKIARKKAKRKKAAEEL